MLDKQSEVSYNQAVTATAVSENSIDLGVPGTPTYANGAVKQDMGAGTPIPLEATVTEDFATLTSLQVQVVTSDNADLSGYDVAVETKAVPVADLTAGYRFAVNFLPEKTSKRYLGLRYVVAGTAATAGQVTAGISTGNQSNG